MVLAYTVNANARGRSLHSAAWVLKTFCLAGTRMLFNRQQSTASACYLLYVPLTEAPAKLATKLTDRVVTWGPAAGSRRDPATGVLVTSCQVEAITACFKVILPHDHR